MLDGIVSLIQVVADSSHHEVVDADKAAVVQSITSPFDVDTFDIVVALIAIVAIAITYTYIKSANDTAKANNAKVMSAVPPPATAVTQKPFTLAELASFNGADASTPLYIACAGKVYDVSAGRGFYGPGGAYGVFAGRDASRGLGKMEVVYSGPSIDDLAPAEVHTMREWADKYDMKYPIVGWLHDTSEPNSGYVNGRLVRAATTATTSAADGNANL